MATANARDGYADAPTVCGRDGGGPLNSCPGAGTENLADCLDVRSTAGLNYVEVRTATQTADGTLLPPAFAAAVAPGYAGTRVGACARVAWAVPRAADLAFTISACEWRQATDNGTDYAPAPPATVREEDGYEQVLLFRTPGGGGGCPAGPSGWDRPGVFGWMEGATGSCAMPFVPPLYLGDAAPSNACRDALASAREDRRVLFVPVYDVVFGIGAFTTYRLYGMAAFVVTGFQIQSAREDSTITGRRPCGPGQTCVSGYFVDVVADLTGPVDDDLPYLGLVAVRTIA
jgi:hypothetical protein